MNEWENERMIEWENERMIEIFLTISLISYTILPDLNQYGKFNSRFL